MQPPLTARAPGLGSAGHAAAPLRRRGRSRPGGVRCRDPENPVSFALYERYRDKAAWEEHGKTEHFERIALGQLFPSLESRERLIYETL
jgi:hypothetical protein